MTGAAAPGALKGISIVEIDSGNAQFAGKLLGDLGADVIKLEPIGGAPARAVGPFLDDDPGVDNSLQFWHLNTSKRSVTLDLDHPTGAELLRALLTAADIVLVDAPREQMVRRGLDHATLRATHPDLIYCDIAPFGREGPWAGYLSSDLVQLAMGGYMAVCGYADQGLPEPVAPTGGQAVNMTGLGAAMGCLSALCARLDGAGGQLVDVATHDLLSLSTEMGIPFWEFHQRNGLRQTGRHGRPYPTPRWNHRCRDGKYFSAMPLYLDDPRYAALVEWMAESGMAEDLQDERYRDEVVRAHELPHIVDVVSRFCARHDCQELFDGAQARRLPWAPINAPEDLLASGHLTEDRHAFEQVEHPELGRAFTYPGAPYRLSATPWRVSRRPPRLGEHTDEVLGTLGIDADRLETLRAEQVIR